MRCTCGSYAINHTSHGRDGSDGDKCDVCYWRSRAERYAELLNESGSEDPHGGRFVCDCLDADGMDNERAQEVAGRIVAMERLVHNLLDPEMYGYAVTAEVRDAARVALGMRPVETAKHSNA